MTLVKPLHKIAGRARFRVYGLYGNEQLKARLEQALAARAGVNTVKTDVRTGTLLVTFDPRIDLQDIAAFIGIQLESGRALAGPTKASERSAGSTPIGVARPATPSVRPRAPHAAAQSLCEEEPWHSLPVARALDILGSSPEQGLDAEEALRRLHRLGPNALPALRSRSALAMLASQFNTLPVILLAGSAVVSAFTGGLADAAVILGVMAINGGIGFATERQAERTIHGLQKAAPVDALVLRDGRQQRVPVASLVPGDIVALAPGDHVPADLRLIQARQLVVDESPLTGESLPVSKSEAATLPSETPLAERSNMTYMGTMVAGGGGLGLVVATGGQAELGRIQALVGTSSAPQTPLQRQLDAMGRELSLISAAVCAGVFGVGLLRGYGVPQMLSSAISLAVAAVPEGLPAVATTTLALGIQRMRRDNVAVRHLTAVETLGAVQVFCLDKTGTLTLNRMTVMAARTPLETFRRDAAAASEPGRAAPECLGKAPELEWLVRIGVLCSDTELHSTPDGPRLSGSPTENALVQMALEADLDVARMRAEFPRLETRYRSEGRPYMITCHQDNAGGRLVAVKGSPAEVLAMCSGFIGQGGARGELDEDLRATILSQNEAMAGEGLRVLGMAFGTADDADADPSGLTWAGMVGLADPLRPGMPELMSRFHQAGIRTVMITGDQSATAYAIGKQAGLVDSRPIQILDSANLDKLEGDLLSALVEKTDIFARVSPAHKLQIVQALQRTGKVVAMTGDGINDGPALKVADVGVAMGANGSEVARSVANVVLEDDNLETMVTAVAQGRTIYGNIRKTLRFLLSTNFSEIQLMFCGVALGLGQPLNPMQLLWINLATDIFPALGLALDSPEPDVLDQPPRDPLEPILRRRDLAAIVRESAVITAGSMANYLYALRRYGPGPQAQTHVFMALTAAQLLHSKSCRSEHFGLFRRGHRPRNGYLDTALLVTAGMQGLTLAIPGLRRLLGTAPLGLADLLVIGAGAIVPVLVNDAAKLATPSVVSRPSSFDGAGTGTDPQEVLT